jgi:5-methyltetrahydrofolate--homocysteine methyltransferase
MEPEASVCGFFFSHPASGYFSAGDVEDEYLADYARRAGLSEEEARSGIAATRG